MSVINRIEIANLLNKHGDIASPWEAKMRHLLLDLRGQSSAISMENGFGKTTMAEALIGMLSRDRQLLTRTRRKCSPSKVNGEGRSWTHLRVEFRAQDSASQQDDMLAVAGEEVAGETFVFGMYGYSDGSGLVFYHYPGKLADVPVHHITRDGKLALYANADFQSTMRAQGVTRAHNREEWLEAVGVHISRRELAQMAAFQKEGGADKSQIFNAIKPRAGEKADQAFFYEVLAPQILSGATRGETDEEEELIEDVILNSGTRITELRHRLAEAASDQQRADEKVERLATLNEEGEGLLEARRQLTALDASLLEAERLLGGQALAPLPGLPGADGDEKGRGLAKEVADSVIGFAWVTGDTERPRVSTWLLAKLSRQSERNVRLALSERGARVDTHRRLIHLPAAAWVSARDIGHVSFDQARAWLADSHAFHDDAARYRALGVLDDGAEAFEALDGNRFREEVIADREYRRSLRLDAEQLDEEVERLEQEREQLESRQRDFIDNQSVYTQALAEGLFTEAELEAPEATREAAQSRLGEARKAHADHLGRMGELKQPAQWYDEFLLEHPDASPEELLATKGEQQEMLEAQLGDWDAQASTLERQRETTREALQARREQRQRLEGELAPLAAGRDAWQAFAAQWPEHAAVGFWSERKSALAELEQALAEVRRAQNDAKARLDRLSPLRDAAERYRHWHGEASPVHLRETLYRQSREAQDRLHQLTQQGQQLEVLEQALSAFRETSEQPPSAWLKDAKLRYPRLLRERETLAGSIEAREGYLDSLSGDPLARLASEAEAQHWLEAREIAFRPLHEVLAALEADDEQRRGWLAQSAGQLFAPVVEGEDDAREASQCLVDAGCGVPVLEANRLRATLARGELPLGAVQGVETLAVKAALDPAYLTALREETQQRLAVDRERQQALQEEIERLDPHGERFRQALQADEALTQEVELQLATLAEQRESAEAERDALEPRLGEAAMKSIDDFQRFLEEGGEPALQSAAEAAQSAAERVESLSPQREQAARELETHGELWLSAERFATAGGVERLGEIDASLSALAEELAEHDERFAEILLQIEELNARRETCRDQLRHLFADGERERLRRLAAFVAEGGPHFMRDADAREAALAEALAHASRRADFDFDRIRAFLQVRDDQGGNRTLERDIGRLKQSLKEMRERRKASAREQSELESRLARHQQALTVVDQLAVAWLEVLRQLPEGWFERATADAKARWPASGEETAHLDAAMDEWRRWALASLDGAGDTPGKNRDADVFDLEAFETCQQTLLDGLGSLNLGERARNRERQARDVTSREKALADSLESASASRLFNETERARLGTLEGVSHAALESLRGLHRQLGGQLDEHRQRVARLHASREQIEDTLVERLSSIIIDAAGNLEILKRVAKRTSDGGAYFEVKADLIADESVRELIQQLLADIDAHLAVQRRRLEQASDGSQPKGGRDDELTRQIRRRIYRGLFCDVTIRLKHDAIRPHGRLFSLNEDMSEGQREAVSLMWLVKLSEFAIERELRELPGSHKRRARASRESVILLDGLFSKLSHRRLIQDSLESLRNTRGRFQMIGLIHNPNYENDPSIFPTYLVGSVIGGQQGQGGHVIVREGQAVAPEETGRGSGEASLFGIHVTPAPVA